MKELQIFLLFLLNTQIFAQIPEAVRMASKNLVSISATGDPSFSDLTHQDKTHAAALKEEGNGFFVKKGNKLYLVSAAHVIAFNGTVSINIPNTNKKYLIPREKCIWDTQNDLAICCIDENDLPNIVPLSIAQTSENNSINDKAYIPLKDSVSEGVVVELDKIDNTDIPCYHLVKSSNKIQKGDSGSPLLEKDGNVVGVVLRKDSNNNALSLDNVHFLRYFEQLCQSGKVSRPYLGLALKMNNNKIEIIPLEKNELLKGQYLTHINGKRVYSLSEVHQIIEDIDATKSSPIKITLDNGQLISLDIENAIEEKYTKIASFYFENFVEEGKEVTHELDLITGFDLERCKDFHYHVKFPYQLGLSIRTFAWNKDMVFNCPSKERYYYFPKASNENDKTQRVRVLIL